MMFRISLIVLLVIALMAASGGIATVGTGVGMGVVSDMVGVTPINAGVPSVKGVGVGVRVAVGDGVGDDVGVRVRDNVGAGVLVSILPVSHKTRGLADGEGNLGFGVVKDSVGR